MSPMTAYERVAAALAHRPSDRVPCAPILAGVTRRLVGADYPTWSTDAAVCAEAFLRAIDTFGLDALVTLIDLSVECDAWGQPVVYPPNEAARPDYKRPVIASLEDYDKIEAVDFRTSRRMMMHREVCRRLVAEKKGKVPIVAFVFGPLGTLSMLRGQENLYMDLYDGPDRVKAATERVADTLLDYALSLVDVGVDAIMWDTLFASGSIMSREMWLDTEAGAMRRLSAAVRERGCMNMIHNCGQKIYFDLQIEAIRPAAISFLYPPHDCADFAACKARYGGQTTLIGCLPPTDAVFGSDADWDENCRRQIEAMGHGGGFILSTGCEYPANADTARAERMLAIARATHLD